jgi:hypothetical protein
MQLKSEKQSLIACFLIVLLAYLPVSSFLFAVKNDMFTGYFPLKRFMSDSIDAGVFPLWNPYLNYGFPIYGDMSLGWWNPGTWLFSWLGYNPWTFTIELIMYLLMAVAAMHKLASLWTSDIYLRSMAAIAYPCCGFFVGNMQHFNWVAGAAVFPMVVYLLFRYLNNGRAGYLAATAFAATWFSTIAHPGLIIGSLFFLAILIPVSLDMQRSTIKRIASAVFLCLLCSAGMIYGYADVLPYTNREKDVASLITGEGSGSLFSWISFFYPLAANKGEWFKNDISMRNCYVGLMFIAALGGIANGAVNRRTKLIGLVGLLFLILSTDFFIPVFRHLPVLNYIRLTGELRIFALLAFIIAGVMVLDQWLLQSVSILCKHFRMIRILMAVTILISALALVLDPPSLIKGPDARAKIKWFIDYARPPVLFLIHAFIQLLICTLLIRALSRGQRLAMVLIIGVEFVLATLFNLPFTGVGQRSVATLDRLYDQAPPGLVAPANTAEKEVASGYPQSDLITGNWALVSKQIAQRELIPYPLYFPATESFLEGPEKIKLQQRAPFFLLSGISMPGIPASSFFYSWICFDVSLHQSDTLIIKQNMFPGWRITDNGKKQDALTTTAGFISIPLTKGRHELVARFDNKTIRTLLILHFMVMTALLLIYLFQRRPTASDTSSRNRS